jgi:hypothetical protein
MADEIRTRPIESKLLESSKLRKQLDVLSNAVLEAQKQIDYSVAHNPQIEKAIQVVEHFLRKTGRVCYGGQAINAHLPDTLKFYDDEYDVPDYDFFTPNSKKDIRELVSLLKRAGFDDISEKPGVHEGTRKIYVNFIPIADMTNLDEDLYERYSKNAIIVAGIHYANEDILRMMMYLELSRPQGEVERWNKVFERLTLLNTAKPIQRCTERTPRISSIDSKTREKIIQYIIQEKKVLAGAEVGFIYRTFNEREPSSMEWIVHSGGPIVFFSDDLESDSLDIQEIIGKKGTVIQRKDGYGDYIPSRTIVRKNKRIVAYLIDETSCNSFNEVPIQQFGTLRIASLDTLIYLFLLLGLLADETKTLGLSLLCVAQRFIELLSRMRGAPFSRFPVFTITCSGHQKSFATLLRDKASRAKKPSKTRSASTVKNRSTKRSKVSKNNKTKKNIFKDV